MTTLSDIAIGRPGTGGRQPHATPYTATTATEELIERHGAPHYVSSRGCPSLTWVENPNGEGIVFARLSSRDLQMGETAMLQIHPGRALCDGLGLVPRLLVVTTNNSGARDFDERPDFKLVVDAVAAGWCKFVVWRDQARVAREPMPFEAFWRFLREHQIDFYLTSLGRKVDWRQDRLLLRTLNTVSAEDREWIKQRTHDALAARWLREGRGWPGARMFGFRRNPLTKFLEVDPEQWEFVKRIHLGYARLEDGRGGGVGRVVDELKALGCELSPSQVRRVLRDRVYVDGRWNVTYEGERHPGRTISLNEPIPEAVFQRNQELFATRRGKSTTTPLGTFCLNSVDFVHASCEHERNARGLPARLRGRLQGDSPARMYRHSPWVPGTCRGFSIEQDQIEPHVIEAVVAVAAGHPAVLKAWRDARRAAGPEHPELLAPSELESLRRRIGALQRQLARLQRHYIDRLAAGDQLDERDYGDLVHGVRRELAHLRARVAASEVALHGLDRTSADLQDADGLTTALRAVATPDVPADPALRAARAALINAALTRVRVRDGDDGVTVELTSPLGPSSGTGPDQPSTKGTTDD